MNTLYRNIEFKRFCIFLVWLINVSGFFGILSDQREFYLSATPYVLTLTVFILILNHNILQKDILKTTLFIILAGILVEILGVNYGLFFGEYKYGDTLGVKVFGVPIVIGLNWLMLSMISANFIDRIIKNKLMLKILLSSILMVSLDVFIEKVAPALDFWKFDLSPVPLSNFIWWLIFSLIFHSLYFKYIKEKEYVVSTNLLIIHFLFFGLLSVFL